MELVPFRIVALSLAAASLAVLTSCTATPSTAQATQARATARTGCSALLDRTGPIQPSLAVAERDFREAAASDADWGPLLGHFTAFEHAVREHPIFAAPQFAIQEAFFTSCDGVLGRSQN